MLLGFEPGQKVTLTVQRFGTQRTVPVTLGEPPAPPRAPAARGTDSVRAGAAPAPRLGVSVAPLTPELARELQLPQTVAGVVIGGVDPAGPAAGLLLPGEVVTAVFGPGGVQRPVRAVSDLQQAVAAARGGVVSLLVYTPQARGTRVVSVPLR
jgi:serine protease Do